MLQYKELLAVCVEGLNNFMPESQSVEDYIKNFLKLKKDLDDDDHVFIVEVFSGCVQYYKILNVVVDGFYSTDGKNSSVSDTQLYKVLCYMIIFRLDELGISNLKKFINSQNTLKMHRFLKFFMKEENLSLWIYDQWCQQYDKIFVDQEIVQHIMRWKRDLDEIVDYLEDKMNNHLNKKLQKKPLTRPKSFNLTKPKPRQIPLPERLPTLPKRKSIPKTTFKEPKEFVEIEKIREENQQRSEQVLLNANEGQFLCAKSEKSLKTQLRVQNVIDEENQKLHFNKKHSKELPDYKTENKPIKLNAATVLREGALFEKKEKEELERLEKLLRGERNASDFLQWQSSMRQKDLEEQLVEAEERRVKGKLSREEAILARQNNVKDKQDLVSKFRMENAKMMQEFLEMRLDEEKQMKSLVDHISMNRLNTQAARFQLHELNRKSAMEVNDESRELLRRALEEAEEEMRRKSTLIQEIRAMESVPVNRVKLVDLTSTAGHALLSEMSIAELKERLCLLKEAHQQDIDSKKDTILKEKQAKNDAIMETIARVSIHRNEINKASKRNAEDKIRQLKLQEERVRRDERVIALQEKLEKKKEERVKRAKELFVEPNKKTSLRTLSLIRDKKKLETKRWLQVEKGYQRQAENKLRNLSASSSSRLIDGQFQSTPTLKGF